MTRGEKLVVACLFVLLAYAAWVRGGTHSGYQPPLLTLGAACFLSVFAGRWLDRGILAGRADTPRLVQSPPRLPLLRSLLGDPVVYAGSLFLCLLLIQWLNAGRWLKFDYVRMIWYYTPARIPWLPSAVNKVEALEMLYWFVPALALVLAVRHGLNSARSHRAILGLVIVNSVLLALFGVSQLVSGTHSIFWTWPLRQYFFASFGYCNHAAAFFNLALALSLGWGCARLAQWPGRRIGIFPLAGLVAAVVINFVAAHLARSLAGIIICWLATGAGFLHVLVTARRRLAVGQWLNTVLLCLVVASIAGLLVMNLGGDMVRRELGAGVDVKELRNDYFLRLWQIQTAGRIWHDSPWFGVGGWGYRYFMSQYVLPEQASTLLKGGMANVHTDGMQFLAEFGVVGLGLMLVVVACLLHGTFKPRAAEEPLVLFCLLGCLFTLLHSVIDIPFKSPAVMYMWLTMLACSAGILKGPATARHVSGWRRGGRRLRAEVPDCQDGEKN